VPLPFESRKGIPDVNHIRIFFGSLVVSLIALGSSPTENHLIQKFCNL